MLFFSVFSEIKDELVSPSLIALMADFLTALIGFLMSTPGRISCFPLILAVVLDLQISLL